MQELSAYRTTVDAYWPAVDKAFDELPGDLYRRGRLLRQTLAVHWSATGDFHDILRRPDDRPLLQYHLWLLDDVGVARDDARTSVEARLFAATVYTGCIGFLHRELPAADSFIDAGYGALAAALSRRTMRAYGDVVDPESLFWDTYQALWDGASGSTTEARHAPFMLSGLAALDAVGRSELHTPLFDVLRHLNAVLSMREDLLAIRRDLSRGTITEPVRAMLSDAGLSENFADPDAVFGSLLLSGAIDAVAPLWSDRLQTFVTGAAELDLPTLVRYGEHLGRTMDALGDTLRMSGPPSPGVPASRFEPASDPVPGAIAMAERYLVADPTFRDAWEVHRWGMADAPEVTARFPSGLVIEVLGRHEHDVAELVDDFLRQIADQGFAYYDHPDLPYIETDTLGTMLRLYPFTKKTEWHRRLLEDYLALLRPDADGRLPVWLTRDTHLGLLGEHCGTIEANLLRGLLDYDADRFAPVIEASATRLLADFADRTAGITVNYPRPYLLAVLSALLVRLERLGLVGWLDETWSQLTGAITLEAQRDRMTPMTAALLMLACSAGPAQAIFEDRWPTVVLKGQAFDGGWSAEPMFFAPNRGQGVTWHASRLLTSAVCYDALANSIL